MAHINIACLYWVLRHFTEISLSCNPGHETFDRAPYLKKNPEKAVLHVGTNPLPCLPSRVVLRCHRVKKKVYVEVRTRSQNNIFDTCHKGL